MPWLQQTVDLVLPHLPTPLASFKEDPNTSLPPPIYNLEYEPSIGKLTLNAEQTEAPTRMEDALNGVNQDDGKPQDWIWARLARNRRVTKEGWWQDVRDIELEIEDG